MHSETTNLLWLLLVLHPPTFLCFVVLETYILALCMCTTVSYHLTKREITGL